MNIFNNYDVQSNKEGGHESKEAWSLHKEITAQLKEHPINSSTENSSFCLGRRIPLMPMTRWEIECIRF